MSVNEESMNVMSKVFHKKKLPYEIQDKIYKTIDRSLIVRENLKRFGLTGKFEAKLCRNDGYISGSSMLIDDSKDMDIYVPRKQFSRFHKTMLSNGYDTVTKFPTVLDKPNPNFEWLEDTYDEFTTPVMNILYDDVSIFNVITYYNKNLDLTVDLILCHNHPLVTISQFDLTCNINWFNGYSYWFYHKGVDRDCYYNTGNRYTTAQKNTTKDRIIKYEKRGYNISNKSIDSKEIFKNMLSYSVTQQYITNCTN